MNSIRNKLERVWFKVFGKKFGKMSLFSRWRRIPGSQKVEFSPDNKYTLIIDRYWTGPGSWEYTKGTVKNTATGKVITEVHRNYHTFWSSWVLGHKDGHDYLLCGEDYQGQTVIRLDTGERKDYLSEHANKGWGFCWVDAKLSPDGSKLAAYGCYWACPWEVKVVDFTKPLESLELLGFSDCNDNIDDLVSWNDDGTITVKVYEEYRKSDGKSYSDMTEDERDKAEEDSDCDYRDAVKTVKIKESGG